MLGNCSIRQFKFNYYQRQDIELFSIAKCLIARLYPGCSNVNDGNSLIPYMVGFTLTNSFNTNTITGNLSHRKELLDKALAMIVVPLFNDDDESLELFIQTNGATNKRHTISSTLTKGDTYVALCKNEKRKCQQNSLNCGIHCGVHKLMHAEKFLPDDTKVHTTIRAIFIMYIQPTNEVLEPPIEKDHSNVSKKYVVHNNKLFQLVDNKIRWFMSVLRCDILFEGSKY